MRSAIKMCWISLAAAGFISAIVIGISEDVRETGFPFRIALIPWAAFFLSAMFYAIAHRDEHGFGWKTAGGWGFWALAVLMFMWWNPPLPKPYFVLPRHVGLIIDLVLLAAITVYFYRRWRRGAGTGIEDAVNKLEYYLLLKVGRVLNRKQNRRVARLTLEQQGFLAGAFADALEGPQEKGYSNSEEHHKAIEIARQISWEKLFERWPELRGKV